MRTFATLKKIITPKDKDIIVRNLNRILDIVILDIDSENSTITFLHASKATLDAAKKELHCIGFPIINLQVQKYKKSNVDITRTLV